MNAQLENWPALRVVAPANDARMRSTAASEYVVETEGLTLQYGRKFALKDLSLRVPRGRIHAIVGANGAGKSSLFRVLLGFQTPSSGSARILDQSCAQLSPEVRGRIGFVNDEHTMPEWMRIGDVVAMQRRQYPQWDQARFDETAGHFNVLPEQKVAQLSRGERAGINLAMALAQSPELLILDEPTLGLDVVAKRAFLEALMFCNSVDACTIIYCSHQMEEIERVADNLIILERGELKHMSAPDEFCERVSLWVADLPAAAVTALRARPEVLLLQKLDGLVHVLILDRDAQYGEVLTGFGARHVQTMPVSLDRAVNAFLTRDHAAPAEEGAGHVRTQW